MLSKTQIQNLNSTQILFILSNLTPNQIINLRDNLSPNQNSLDLLNSLLIFNKISNSQ